MIDELTLGHLRTGWDAGCAAAVARVLEAHEVEVEYLDLDPEERARALASGEVDLIACAWMPRDAALVPEGGRVLGGLYKPAYVWAVGPGVDVASIDDLNDQSIGRIITPSGLESLLARGPSLKAPVVTCDEEALYATIEQALEAGDRVLVATEQPNAVFHGLGLTVLADPQARLGAEMEARIVLGPRAAKGCHPDLLDELDEMMLSAKVMNALDHAISVDEMDPEDAAEAWQRGKLIPR